MKFELIEEEEVRAKEWMKSQKEKKSVNSTIGGRFSFIITPTSIGDSIKIVDNLLKEEIDVTDYSIW